MYGHVNFNVLLLDPRPCGQIDLLKMVLYM